MPSGKGSLETKYRPGHSQALDETRSRYDSGRPIPIRQGAELALGFIHRSLQQLHSDGLRLMIDPVVILVKRDLGPEKPAMRIRSGRCFVREADRLRPPSSAEQMHVVGKGFERLADRGLLAP